MADSFPIDTRADDLADEEMAEAAIDSPSAIKRKGRGFQSSDQQGDGVHGAAFDRLHSGEGDLGGKAMKSIEGWIVLATGVHEEATEEDIQDRFGDFGEVKNIHMNLDRRTGYVKGYALIEYGQLEQAQNAIAEMNGAKLLDQTLACDFAFVKPAQSDDRGRRGGYTSRNRGGHNGRRSGRSSSPSRR